MERIISRSVLACLPALLAACAIDSGLGFAHLEAHLTIHAPALDPAGERITADGWVPSDNDFSYRLTSVELEISRLEFVLQGATAVESCSFDPADPPQGCGGCHGGHCHCDDQLVSYEEVEALACGDASSGASVTRLDLAESLVLAEGRATRELAECSPSCELPRSALSEVRLLPVQLRISGEVRDDSSVNRLGADQPKILLTLDLSSQDIHLALEPPLAIDGEHPYPLLAELELELAETLLDGIAWHQLVAASDGSISINTTQNAANATSLTTEFFTSTLAVEFERGGEEHLHDGH